VIHYNDAVGLEYRGQTMRNDYGGATLHQPLEGLLHEAFGFRVEGTGRLVQ
jgi:hypothetical protein